MTRKQKFSASGCWNWKRNRKYGRVTGISGALPYFFPVYDKLAWQRQFDGELRNGVVDQFDAGLLIALFRIPFDKDCFGWQCCRTLLWCEHFDLHDGQFGLSKRFLSKFNKCPPDTSTLPRLVHGENPEFPGFCIHLAEPHTPCDFTVDARYGKLLFFSEPFDFSCIG